MLTSRHAQRGSIIVEFALGSFFALLLLIGSIGFGRAVMTYHLVGDLARMGTRYAIVRGSSCTVTGCPITGDALKTYVKSKASGIDASQLTVTTTWGPSSSGCSSTNEAYGCWVNVTVSYPYTFPGYWSAITLSSSSQMIISQ